MALNWTCSFVYLFLLTHVHICVCVFVFTFANDNRKATMSIISMTSLMFTFIRCWSYYIYSIFSPSLLCFLYFHLARNDTHVTAPRSRLHIFMRSCRCIYQFVYSLWLAATIVQFSISNPNKLYCACLRSMVSWLSGGRLKKSLWRRK